MEQMTKICTVCNLELRKEAFYNCKATKDGKSYRCKSCDRVCANNYKKTQYLKHRELRRKVQRKSKYGLTEDGFDELLKSQDGLCAICNVVLDQGWTRQHKPNKLVVDHNHKTGEVRGLLCTMCNKGIGLLKDDPAILERALGYLNRTH